MPAVPPVPCPVRLGKVRPGGLPALLHDAACESNVRKLEKLLKKGVDVDCENNLGQTPLFCASLLGFTNVVELLLQYGANPNYRCMDGSTPVHAAVFSCKPWLLSGLLDAGGDLRLHDDQGRTPRDWAEAGAQEYSPKTTLAHIIASSSKKKGSARFVTVSATSASTSDVRGFIKQAQNELRLCKRKTILFIGEIHCFNKSQQDTFLPHVECGTITLIGATTENASFQVNSALLSRCRVLVLEKLSVEAMGSMLLRAVDSLELGVMPDDASERKRLMSAQQRCSE